MREREGFYLLFRGEVKIPFATCMCYMWNERSGKAAQEVERKSVENDNSDPSTYFSLLHTREAPTKVFIRAKVFFFVRFVSLSRLLQSWGEAGASKKVEAIRRLRVRVWWWCWWKIRENNSKLKSLLFCARFSFVSGLRCENQLPNEKIFLKFLPPLRFHSSDFAPNSCAELMQKFAKLSWLFRVLIFRHWFALSPPTLRYHNDVEHTEKNSPNSIRVQKNIFGSTTAPPTPHTIFYFCHFSPETFLVKCSCFWHIIFLAN